MRPLYGDIHNHCGLSYGYGSLEDALRRARRQLDFVSVTGHAHWPDMPVDDPLVAHIVAFHVEGFAKLQRAWPAHFETLAAYDRPGFFTAFPGYEIHSCASGDYTILYRDLEPREMILADSPAELAGKIRAQLPGRAIAFPHHIGYRTGARGINWESFDPSLSPVIEMISMHGCAETSLTDRPYLHSMGPADGRSTMRHGLRNGQIFGVVGNSDHHSAYPGSYGHGRMSVYASEHSRASIWDAIRERRTNALTGDCIHLFATLAGAAQGGIVDPQADAELAIEAVGGSFIDVIDVIRNGDLAARITPALSPSPIGDDHNGRLETILVLEMGWGARKTDHRWTGRLRVSGGRILAVEPRLRGPEIVSPLEGREESSDDAEIECSGEEVRFSLVAAANPNNMTPATQAIALHLSLSQDASIEAEFDGRKLTASVDRLLEGALSGNLGPIDSPAFRFHPLPHPHEWQWRGSVRLDAISDGESVYVRMRQSNGQYAWSSPLFCRSGGA
ncbi:MAG: hypothetical protein ACRED5_05750 [Propylenella sp.]